MTGTTLGGWKTVAAAPAAQVPAPTLAPLSSAAIGVIYTLIAFVMLLPSNPGTWATSIPDQSGDNLLNLWILRWGSGHLVDWHALWNAPIFWPHHNTFAYSESMLPVAVVYGVLAHILGAALTFNLIYVAAGAASMFATYLLAKHLTSSASGAFIAGLIYALAPPRIAQYGHFQLSFGFLIPITLLCTLRFFETRSTGRALALGGVAALLCLSASYYALMTAIALAIIVAGLALKSEREHRGEVFRRLGLAAGLTLLVVAPVVLHYNSLHHEAGFHREPNPWLSARPSDFLRVAEGNRVLGNIPPLANVSSHDSATVENRLFPGVVALGLGTAGVATLVRRRRDKRTRRSLDTTFLSFSCVSALVLLVLAFGNQATIAGSQYALPFHLLENMPGFDEIRAPARFIAFPLLIVAMLAALGCSTLLERMRTPRGRGIFVGACVAVLLLESATAVTMKKVPTSSAPATAANSSLARLPAGPVAELPMISEGDGGLLWATVETQRMWLAGIDGNPRVNGFSGFQPRGFDALADEAESATGPSELARSGVRYLVLHVSASADDQVAWRSGAFTQKRAEEIVSSLPTSARVIRRYDSAWLIDLQPSQSSK